MDYSLPPLPSVPSLPTRAHARAYIQKNQRFGQEKRRNSNERKLHNKLREKHLQKQPQPAQNLSGSHLDSLWITTPERSGSHKTEMNTRALAPGPLFDNSITSDLTQSINHSATALADDNNQICRTQLSAHHQNFVVFRDTFPELKINFGAQIGSNVLY